MVALLDSDEIFVKGIQALFVEKNIPLDKVVTNYKIDSTIINKLTVLIGDPYKSPHFNAETIQKAMKQNSNLRVLVITSIANKPKVDDVISIGVHGVLFKCCKMEEFISAYFKAIKGECHYCSSIKDNTNVCLGDKLSELSEREIEIANLIYEGKTTADIALALSRSVHTVNSHRKNILKKLKIKTPLELLKLMSDTEL